jgi:hypothetical protein
MTVLGLSFVILPLTGPFATFFQPSHHFDIHVHLGESHASARQLFGSGKEKANIVLPQSAASANHNTWRAISFLISTVHLNLTAPDLFELQVTSIG